MSDQESSLQRPRRFATTHWSVVLRAGGSPDEESHQALGELIETYWYPLYAFARQRGNSHHDALDLTQGFFAHMLKGPALQSVSPEYGRFRTFLLASFKNYMANEHRASETLRRGGGVKFVSLNLPDFESRFAREPIDAETPELVFERRWVESLLTCVRARLKQEYQRAEKAELFELLEPHLNFGENSIPRGEIGQRLNLSLAAVAMSLHRMRRRFGELLRSEVAATVDNPAEIDDEVRTLMDIVSRSGHGPGEPGPS